MSKKKILIPLIIFSTILTTVSVYTYQMLYSPNFLINSEDKFIITTNTPSAKSIISEKNNLYHQYLPVDWLYSISKFIKNTKPKICILIETELWPNLVSSCKKRQVPVLIANARLSKKTINSPEFIRDIYML